MANAPKSSKMDSIALRYASASANTKVYVMESYPPSSQGKKMAGAVKTGHKIGKATGKK